MPPKLKTKSAAPIPLPTPTPNVSTVTDTISTIRELINDGDSKKRKFVTFEDEPIRIECLICTVCAESEWSKGCKTLKVLTDQDNMDLFAEFLEADYGDDSFEPKLGMVQEDDNWSVYVQLPKSPLPKRVTSCPIYDAKGKKLILGHEDLEKAVCDKNAIITFHPRFWKYDDRMGLKFVPARIDLTHA